MSLNMLSGLRASRRFSTVFNGLKQQVSATPDAGSDTVVSHLDAASGRPLIPKHKSLKPIITSIPIIPSLANTFVPADFRKARALAPELERTRVVPVLNTFYSQNPPHETNMKQLNDLLRKHRNLPVNSVPVQYKWISIDEYRTIAGDHRLKNKQYDVFTNTLNRLGQIDEQLLPTDVNNVLNQYKSKSSLRSQQAREIKQLDSEGRALAYGGRKSAIAKVYLVKGEGEFLVNNRKMYDYFPRLVQRQAMLYPLKVVESELKYNIFAIVSGGGPSAQADAVANAIAKAIVIHNPLLKKRLRLAGTLTRDARVVERKKPGKRKARKSPTWVKR